MKRNPWLEATLLLVVALIQPPQSAATTAISPASVESLTQRSDLVVHGTVETIQSFTEGQRIFTHIRIRVSESLKGGPDSKALMLELYGGVHGGKRTTVLGAPCLSEGEEVVLFLDSNQRSSAGQTTYHVVNLAEGKFSVIRSRDGSARVQRDLRGIHYLDTTRTPSVPETLEAMKTAVHAATR